MCLLGKFDLGQGEMSATAVIHERKILVLGVALLVSLPWNNRAITYDNIEQQHERQMLGSA